jgi:hypothetical protein
MIATARLTDDDLQVLRDAKRDRVAATRPAQLAERAALFGALMPDPAAVKRERDHAAEVKTAEQAVSEAHRNLERAKERVSDLWRASHGRSHHALTVNQDARAKLRATAHPAVPFVFEALIRAGYNAMSVPMSVLGVESIEEEIPPSAEEVRRQWFRPFVRETIRPVTSHASQVAFLEAIGTARGRVEDLAYQALDDTATLAALRAELDNVLRMQLPTNFHHVTNPLAVLRRKLDGDPLSLWTIGEEVIA